MLHYRTLILIAGLSFLAPQFAPGMSHHRVLSPDPAPAASPSVTPSVTPVPVVSPVPGPSGAPQVRVHFTSSSDATPQQAALVAQAELRAAQVVASDCFGAFILTRPMVQTNGLSSAQVLERIRSVQGTIPVTWYWPSWWQRLHNVVDGYELPGDNTAYVNASLAGSFSVCDLASLLDHEGIGHALGGWSHDFNATSRRPYSVPYSINAGFSACCH